MRKSKRSTPRIMHRAVELRKMTTPAEARLWTYLRAHRLAGAGFRRQHAIGNYIVDFYCPGMKLIVELDGSHHLNQKAYDAERTAYLESKGYRVLRFWNSEVMNAIEGVMGVIFEALQEK